MSTDLTTQEQEVVAQVNATVEQASALTVATPEQAQGAVEFLAKIADARKRNEAARVFIVGPLNAQIKAINAKFKENTVPLEEADQVVRGKLLTFRQADERRLAEEQALIDAERRAAEASAEADRRRQAEEAARIEREAREAEEARQAELRQAANERAREIAAMDPDALGSLIAKAPEGSEDLTLARAELASRQAAIDAQARADTARREAEEAQQREIAAKSAPTAVATATQLTSASGSASTRKVWRATVETEALVPRAYLVVDQKAINLAVRNGVREIPGVRIEQVDELAVRAGR
jgi:colicin import membrane protein